MDPWVCPAKFPTRRWCFGLESRHGKHIFSMISTLRTSTSSFQSILQYINVLERFPEVFEWLWKIFVLCQIQRENCGKLHRLFQVGQRPNFHILKSISFSRMGKIKQDSLVIGNCMIRKFTFITWNAFFPQNWGKSSKISPSSEDVPVCRIWYVFHKQM